MTDKDLHGSLIRLHGLHHATEKPIFGLGIIEDAAASRIPSDGDLFKPINGRYGHISDDESDDEVLRRIGALLGAADSALSRARAEGRNRSCVAD